jgi:hypothetical protein
MTEQHERNIKELEARYKALSTGQGRRSAGYADQQETFYKIFIGALLFITTAIALGEIFLK